MKPTPTKPKAKQAKPQKSSTQPKPLNIREERFAENTAAGMKGGPAAKEAGFKGTDASLNTIASRLLRKVEVKAKIEELRARTSANFEMKRENLARHLWLAATTPVGEVDEDSPISAEVTTDYIAGGTRGKLKRGNAPSGNEEVEPTVIRKRVKIQDKLGSARLLCEMMGWKEPEQHVIEAGPKTLDAVRERAREMAAPLGRVINLRP